MHTFIIALGSNHEAVTNLQNAKYMLYRLFKGIRFGQELWSDDANDTEDVNNHTEEGTKHVVPQQKRRYLNCLGTAHTDHSVAQVIRALKNVERRVGDSRQQRIRGIVNIDIDLLSFDGEKYHTADWEKDYLKRLFALDNIKF